MNPVICQFSSFPVSLSAEMSHLWKLQGDGPLTSVLPMISSYGKLCRLPSNDRAEDTLNYSPEREEEKVTE